MRTGQQGFPNPSGPWVNADGTPTQPFIQLLVALWNRTGGAQGISTGGDALIEEILQASRPALGQASQQATLPIPTPASRFDASQAILYGMAFSPCAGLGSASRYNVGTFGPAVPVLNKANVWGQLQTYEFGIELDGAAASNSRALLFSTTGSERWDIDATNEAETGSNTGSNFAINAYTDGGVFLYQPVKIIRATGLFTVNNGFALTSVTSGPGTGAGTLTNAPTAGDPVVWAPIVINGVVRHFPVW